MQVYYECLEFHRDGTCWVLLHHPHRYLKVTLTRLMQSARETKAEDKYIEVKADYIFRWINNIQDSKMPIFVECAPPTGGFSVNPLIGGSRANADLLYTDTFVISKEECNRIIQGAKNFANIQEIPLQILQQ
jgi:hypothetical protein